MSWLRLWFHCFRRIYSDGHRMCQWRDDEGMHDFCECGYLNRGVSYDELKKHYEEVPRIYSQAAVGKETT